MNTIERATTGLVAECGGRAQRRIRIGSFQVGFPEPDGMTTAVRGLSRALASRGHEVTIYGCGAGDADAESRPGLRALLFPLRTRNPFFVPRALLRRLEANEDGLELLMLHSMFHPANVAVARAARRAGIPYIVCPHDPYHPNLLRKNRIR
ncbi:MAG TPA: glycosyltransferase, partial [Bryobacteraceae bacterium]|nr:glycosyltransferase [Bryobacteraceae bacterium]